MTIHQKLVELLAERPDALAEQVAREQGVTIQAVIHALPEAMRRFAPGSHFVDVMKDIGEWGDVTLIIHSDDGVMEFGGPVPVGEIGRGYYNVPGSKGFHGHLRHDRCAEIAFVERPFMGRDSASILFINLDGGVMFKIFVGRDENRALKAAQLERFRALATKLCV